MSYVIVFQPKALRRLEEEYDRVTTAAPLRGPIWFHGLVDAIDSLAEMPDRCALAPENQLVAPTIRQLLYGKRPHVRRVLFTMVDNTVRVLTIRHAAQGDATIEELAEHD